MTKPHLILDIDGVLRDFVAKAFEIYTRDFDPDSKLKIDDIKGFDLKPYFIKLPYSIETFCKTYDEELYFESMPYEDNVQEIVQQLQEKYFIHIVTHQFKGSEIQTLRWLEKYNIPYDAISFSKDKTLIEGYLIVDDGAHNLDDFLKLDRKAVCISRPWNEFWRLENPNQPIFNSLSDFLNKYHHSN